MMLALTTLQWILIAGLVVLIIIFFVVRNRQQA
jgi:hypothetical protein